MDNSLLTVRLSLYSTPLKVESDAPDNANFITPAILVSCLSTSLDGLIQRDGTFVRTPILTLKGVDNDVFWRFFQFLYCGAYMGFKPGEKGTSCETITAFPVDEVTNQPDKSPKRTISFGDSVSQPNKSLKGGLFGVPGGSVGQPNKTPKQGGLFAVPGDSVGQPNKTPKQGGLFGKAVDTLTESVGLPGERSKNNYKPPTPLFTTNTWPISNSMVFAITAKQGLFVKGNGALSARLWRITILNRRHLNI